MKTAAVPFYAATQFDDSPVTASDAQVAGQLAKLFHLEWTRIKLSPPYFSDALALLRMKNGLNHLGMSFMLPFLDALRGRYGNNIVYWTGDSGLVLRRELPEGRVHSYDHLVDCIVRDHAIFQLNDVAKLLRLNVEALRDELMHVLQSYPEESLAQKYVHFVIYGRTIKWHYEGMDRNRFYFWTSAPLEFTPFVNYAMNCPDSQKTTYKLYRGILETMSPESCRITYAQHGLAPASLLFPIVRKIRVALHKMPPAVTDMLRAILLANGDSAPLNSLISKCIKQQLNDCPILREYLSAVQVDKTLESGTQVQRHVILTLTSIIEDLTRSKSSLEQYQEEHFS
jgi:asparagine synthase (glutamine-hydrolysing)